MTFSQSDIMADVRGNLAGPAKLNDPELQQHIREAISIYSKHRPLIKVVELIGDGEDFKFTLPTDFYQGFSEVYVEYPAAEQPARYLDNKSDFGFYQDLTGLTIRFVQPLAATVSAYLGYTTLQRVGVEDSATTTIPEPDRVAIVYYTTKRAAEELAAAAARQAKRTDSDMSLFPGPTTDYHTIASRYERMWIEHMGLNALGVAPAYTQSHIPYSPSWNSGPMIRERRSPLPGA